MKKTRAVGKLVLFVLLEVGCYRSPMEAVAPDQPGSGGAESDGTGGTGGTVANGQGGAGGTIPMTSDPIWTYGGNVGSGGKMGTGGNLGSGNSGGPAGLGGVVGHGGVASYGGVMGSGGDTSNGSQTLVNTGNVVNFSSGKAQDAMTGDGWVALGSLDTITSPTCSGSAITIDRVGIQIPSSNAAITLNNLCITRILFGT